MHAEKIAWVGEPSNKFNGKWKRWPQYTTWPFKLEGDGLEFIMDVDAHEVYLAEKALLGQLTKYTAVVYERKQPDRVKLLKLIETYGEKVKDQARNDVHDEYASRDPSY